MKTGFVKIVMLFGLFIGPFTLAACQAGRKPPLSAATARTPAAVDSPLPTRPPASATPTPAAPSAATTGAQPPPSGPTAAAAQPSPIATAGQPNAAAEPTASQPAVQPPAQPPAQPAAPDCTDLAAFYDDITIPDGTFFRAGEKFTKTWRLRNNGSCTWTPDYQVVFAGGEMMNAPLAVPFPGVVAPGDQVDISIELQAPGRGGSYTSSWEFANPGGVRFGTGQARGTPFWATIQVGFVDSQGVALPAPESSASPDQGHLGGGAAAGALPPGCAASFNPDYVSQVVDLINQARGQNGLAALTENSQLDSAALSHSVDMACNNFLNHTGSDGSSWYDRVAGQGYPSNRARENIYAGTPGYGGDPAGALDWWLNSAVHRANILNSDVTEVGAGFVLNPASDYGGYYTVVFARP